MGPRTRQLREIDALASLWVSDRTMARHDLRRLHVSKRAFSKWSHGLQHEAHRCMLGYSRKGRGTAKNIYIRRISKQKYIKKIYITFHQAKKGFTK